MILGMKYTWIDQLEGQSQKFKKGLDEFDVEMKYVHMKWYLIGAFIVGVVFFFVLIAVCKYACKIKIDEIRAKNKIDSIDNLQENEVFDRHFLKNFREQARQRYMKFLLEK